MNKTLKIKSGLQLRYLELRDYQDIFNTKNNQR